MNIPENSALICIDYINEIVDAKGKLSGKGYAKFVENHATLQNLKSLQDIFRMQGKKVAHVKVGFDADYADQPKNSPLFGKANEFQALKLSDWATDFKSEVKPQSEEKIFVKNRVSAFFNTGLEEWLRSENIQNVYIAGVATDLAVEAAVRDAHDRDFNVTVIANCCAAANEEEHNNSLKTLSKVARVESSLSF